MKEEIIMLLCDVLELDDEKAIKIKGDFDLLGFGLDSLKAIELVVMVEDKYGIMIDDDDLLVENFSTVDKIEKLILSYEQG